MTRHVALTAQTGGKAHFLDPHSSWLRGTCENPNGLTRQDRPKGTDLSVFSHDELDGIADSVNTGPRAAYNWHALLEVFAQTLVSSHKPSASARCLRCCGSDLKPPATWSAHRPCMMAGVRRL
jgi:IS30 family transposase